MESYIKDNTVYLNKLPKEIPKDNLLVSSDVENLYTYTPHDFGLDAIKCWLDNYPTEILTGISQTFILMAFDFILKNNTFQFNDKYYRQQKGTAMGTKFGPSYAKLVLGYLEEILYQKVELIFDLDFKLVYFEKNSKRFLDDCFIIFTKEESELNLLYATLKRS